MKFTFKTVLTRCATYILEEICMVTPQVRNPACYHQAHLDISFLQIIVIIDLRLSAKALMILSYAKEAL